MTRSLRSLLTLLSVLAVVALAPAGASAFTITSGIENGASTNDTSVDLTFFDAEAISSFCTLDSLSIPCTLTGVSLTNLSEGSHTLLVDGTIMSGSICVMWDPIDPSMCTMWMPMPIPAVPASITFTVDLTPPVVTISDGPAEGATIASSSTSFTVGANEGTVSCKLDGAPIACAGSASLSGLASGVHQLVAESTDAAGNIGTATRRFTVAAAQAAVPKILSAPKSAKAKSKISATVACPDGCTITGVVKAGRVKFTVLKKVAPGATRVSFKFTSSKRRAVTKEIRAGKKATLTLTPSGGGESKVVKLK